MKYTNEHIEQYLLGRMSRAERSAFEQEMQGNAELRHETEQYRELFEGFAALRFERHIKSNIQTWEENKPGIQSDSEPQRPTAKIRSLGKTRRLAVAASLLFLLSAGGWWTGSRTYSDQALYSRYYDDSNTHNLLRSAGASEHLLKEGFDAYQADKLDAAAAAFNKVGADDRAYFNQAQYYLGHIHIKNKEWTSAETALKNVVDSKDIRFKEEAEWLLAITHIQAGNEPQAQQHLQTILDSPNHSYLKKAKELQGRLSSPFRKLF